MSVKLTPALLRRVIEEETTKLFGDEVESTADRAKKTPVVDADEYADSLENHIDYVKALKIEEGRLSKRLGKIREAKARMLKRLAARAG